MVTRITTLGRSALQDWLIQRVTAIILGLYVLSLMGYLLWVPHLEYAEWRTLFSVWWMQCATFFAIVSLCLHAWIGIWTVSTDYIKSFALRLILQWIFILALIGDALWGFSILWGL